MAGRLGLPGLGERDPVRRHQAQRGGGLGAVAFGDSGAACLDVDGAARPETPAILEEAARRIGAAYEEAWQTGRGLHLADIARSVPVPAR